MDVGVVQGEVCEPEAMNEKLTRSWQVQERFMEDIQPLFDAYAGGGQPLDLDFLIFLGLARLVKRRVGQDRHVDGRELSVWPKHAAFCHGEG